MDNSDKIDSKKSPSKKDSSSKQVDIKDKSRDVSSIPDGTIKSKISPSVDDSKSGISKSADKTSNDEFTKSDLSH